MQRDLISLVGYSDSDWDGSAIDRRSTSRCCFSLRSGMISWYNSKQKFVALSSAEDEYMETRASCEALWI
jgi:hypothetical protein